MEIESCKGGLWLTAGGRIVLDNHSYEAFTEPYDIKLMTKEELTNGINSSKFIQRLWNSFKQKKKQEDEE